MITMTLRDFAENVKAYWHKRGGYRPAAEDTHLDEEYRFHDNPYFHVPETTVFSEATQRAMADDLERYADEIEKLGLQVDRAIIAYLRRAADNKRDYYKLQCLKAALWVYPIRPKYPAITSPVLQIKVRKTGALGIVRNFERRRLYVELADTSRYFDAKELCTFSDQDIDLDAIVEAVKETW